MILHFLQMNDPSDLINHFDSELKAAIGELSGRKNVQIDEITAQEFLTESLGLSSSISLIDQNLTRSKIVNLLDAYNFPVATAEMECDILPELEQQLLTEVQGVVNNQIWRIHKNDADAFPSNPHAHNVVTGIKLDLSNGETYRQTTPKGRIEKKYLKALRKKVEERLRTQGIELPKLKI